MVYWHDSTVIIKQSFLDSTVFRYIVLPWACKDPLGQMFSLRQMRGYRRYTVEFHEVPYEPHLLLALVLYRLGCHFED
jgi:hypothetical protein